VAVTLPRHTEVLRGFAAVHGRRLETAAIVPDDVRPRAPHIVFLHGAFGSLSSWERFPRDVARATRCPVLVYSRAGHGRSDPPAAEPGPDHLQVEAQAVLPALLDLQGIERPLLVGHEDGAAIALIHAGSGFDVAGVVALSPRTCVDDAVALAVRDAHARFVDGAAMGAFARHHRDPGALLVRWAALWQSGAFRVRTLEPFLPRVTAPVVLVQGEDDELASVADLASLARGLHGRVQSLQIEAVGHAPWEDAPRAVAATIASLVERVRVTPAHPGPPPHPVP
jgi:pimeloyl-ACP methyl ester carboxylesterase